MYIMHVSIQKFSISPVRVEILYLQYIHIMYRVEQVKVLVASWPVGKLETVHS